MANKAMELLEQLAVLVETGFSPQQHIIHKPTKQGNGQALKLQLRLKPKWVPSANGGFFDKEANKEGGFFLEIAAQGPKSGEHPTFLWNDEATLVRCKLGMADISGLLVAIRQVRKLGMDVPAYLQGTQQPKPNVVSLFHKSAKGVTLISYTFNEEQSILRISSSKEKARSIALHLGEEVIFEKVLEMALEAYLKVGKR